MVADDRGQLILIGAIAISLILIGLVLVVNTALFTQVVGTEGSVEMTKEAGVAAEEMEDGVSAVVHKENLADGDAVGSDVESAVRNELDPALRNESMNGAGAFVNVSYMGGETIGTHLNESSDNSSFDDAGSAITIPDNGTIGYARIGIHVSGTGSGNQMTVSVTGDGGTTETLVIEKTGTEQLTLSPPSGGDCEINNAGAFVWIDLTTGFDYTGQCQFDLFDRVEQPATLEFQGGDDVYGNYDVVSSATGLLSDTICSIAKCDEAIWSYELRYQYDTGEVTAVTEPGETREVNVYD